MNYLKTSLLVAALGLASVAQAAIYTDVVLAGSDYAYLRAGSATNGSYSNTFNINQHGYDASSMQVVSATVHFAFADDLDIQSEWVAIELDTWVSAPIEVDGIPLASWTYHWVWGTLGGTLLATLSDTGLLDFTVRALSGDTYLKEARVVADARAVPDSASTLALFGLALLGLAAVRSRFGRR